MKKLSCPMILAVAGLLIASSAPAKAGGTDSCCNDSIVASPKVRAMLDEQCKSSCAAPAQVTTTQTNIRQTDVAASPKVQKMHADRIAAPVIQTTETAGHRATGADGITASPKVRAQLDERGQAVEIAPFK